MQRLTPVNRLPKTSFSLKVSLPSIAIAALLSNTPVLATSQVSSQNPSNQSQPILIAGFRIPRIPGVPRRVNQVVDTVNEVTNYFERRAQEQRAEEERQLREANRIRQREEREAAQRAAAEQRRQYFESLTPEQKQAYIAEQRAKQKAQMDAMAGLFLLLIASDSSGSTSTSDPHYHDPSLRDRPYQSTPQPAPQPVTPIGGNRGIYGDTHTPW